MVRKMLKITIALTTVGLVVKAKINQDMKINRLKKEIHSNFNNLDKYLKKHLTN